MSVLYTAVATASGRDGRAVSNDGKLDVTLAPPVELGGDGAGTNPEQLFAAGYAACFTSAMKLVAGRQKLDVSDASITAEVGLKPNGTGGFGLEVVLRAELPDTVSEADGQKLLEAAHSVCPYSNATRGNIPVTLVRE
ncbi:organic hydroperoxide resistance protein [Actinocorallia sp. API 0066]|uniref:organic hydroperoxide resistance protein n=1 Tax=Actinocorallia sp. API 0066 TaxID=2896846 RepID=UPI001E4547EB|nr:organic hydroperoxide resistance protein [Actinocorallia sp. API 0066]MCD0451873.1 organic hydroperoxide resistance protein [Actinocorallia sp. API 0066]